jgi:hypothetical protein
MRNSVLLLCLATGCFVRDNSDGLSNPPGGGGNPTRPDAGAAVDAYSPDACTVNCWVALGLDPTFPFGAGTEYRASFHKNGTGVVVFQTGNSSIAEVTGVVINGSSKYVRVLGKSAGTTTLIARHGDTYEELDTVALTVEYVASVQLEYRSGPGLDGPVASLAALQGASDSFGIVYRNAAGNPLSGSGGIVTTGGVAIDPAGPVFRASDIFGHVHTRVAVTVGGSGTLGTTLAGDARQFVWPIEVVAAPATISLVPMWLDPNSLLAPLPAAGVKVNSFVGVDIIGRTADGRFVAGVEAVWSSTPGLPPFLTSTTTPETEGVFTADVAGTHTISAFATGGTTYTQQVVVIP